jgi:hypothetical protein
MMHLPRMVASLRSARRAKLVTRVNIIIGHPEEVRADTLRSLRFLVQCAIAGCQDAAVMIFAPYPGSEDTKKLVSKGKVTVDNDYYYLSLSSVRMELENVQSIPRDPRADHLAVPHAARLLFRRLLHSPVEIHRRPAQPDNRTGADAAGPAPAHQAAARRQDPEAGGWTAGERAIGTPAHPHTAARSRRQIVRRRRRTRAVGWSSLAHQVLKAGPLDSVLHRSK